MSDHALKGRTASFSSITEAFPLLRTTHDDSGAKRSTAQNEKLWSLMSSYLASDVHTIQRSICNHIEYTLASSRFDFDDFKAYLATAHSVRDRLIESWNDTNQYFEQLQAKRVSYLSLEFLIGRSMQNALLNMDLEDNYRTALAELGYDLEKLYEQEQDAALGNGGLGRLAACFLDSMATLDLPAWGYGIRYTYGIFKQLIRNGAQVEVPDYWLTFGNPWEIERVDLQYPVRFYGSVRKETGADGVEKSIWEGGEIVQAVAYDNPVPGFDTWNTINLRLFRAAPSREIDLSAFNTGDYMRAVEQRQRAETITHVLYPSDSTYSGKELRLKQQYFFVCATLQDVVRRFKRIPGWSWDMFPEKNAIQLNDTHPSIGIPELMRVLVDEEGLDWEKAWKITQATFAYTNHTILPEALERWSVDLMGHLLPRHLEIVYKINWFWMESVRAFFTSSPSVGGGAAVGGAGSTSGGASIDDRLRVMSLIEEDHGKSVRMANVAIVGSHTVNGVAEIHSELLKTHVFPDFYAMMPHKFQNKTNGVTPRRWIHQCNPGLSAILNKWLDTEDWLKHLDMLAGLRPVAEHPELQREWQAVKKGRKDRLANYIKEHVGVTVRSDALYDVQVKRIHEYKRQLMNALYCIHRYKWILSLTPAERAAVVPRVTFFGGKAAPGYDMAKRIIRLIHRIGNVVNNDPIVGDLFKVVYIPNYNVSLAEIICPASDLSHHISTAGMEASGTSNMKFAMNGGLIIGTMDGANIEIAAEIDRENMFIFGAEALEVPTLRSERASSAPKPYCAELQAVMKDLEDEKFGPIDDVRPILRTLDWGSDYYLTSHDFPSYLRAQAEVDAVYRDQKEWTRRSILSVAGMGKFSTDRTIDEYAKDIWRISPCRRLAPVTDAMGRARSFPALDRMDVLGASGGAGSSSGGVAGSSSGRGMPTSPGSGMSADLGMELGGSVEAVPGGGLPTGHHMKIPLAGGAGSHGTGKVSHATGKR